MAAVVVTVSAHVTVVPGYSSKAIIVKKVHGEKVCDQGWECKGFSKYCCNQTISDFFQVYQFEDHFAKRNIPNLCDAVGIWNYKSFSTSKALFQPQGFGCTGGKLTGMKEVAAFFGHDGAKTSSLCSS